MIQLEAVRSRLRVARLLPGDELTRAAAALFTSPRRFARPAREHALVARATRFAVDVHLDAPGSAAWRRTIPAWRWGEGPPVVLVHGWEGRGAQLGALIEPLVAAGLSVVAFDAPGHGDARGDRLLLADLTACVAAVVAAVGPVHGAIAHSLGALATTRAIARGAAIPRVVYLAPASFIDGALDRFAALVALAPAERRRLAAEMAARNGFAIAAAAPEALPTTLRPDALVIHDVDDRDVPHGESARLVAAWPGARLVTTQGLGHRRILRDRGVIDHAAAFLVGDGAIMRAWSGDRDAARRRAVIAAWVDDVGADELAAAV
jgi:predicted alpha/beta hydrolase family esterase